MANKIIYNRGTTFNITLAYEKNGVPSTAAIMVFFTVKEAIDNDITDSAAFVKKDIAVNGNSVVVTLNPGDISDSIPDGKYVFDIKWVESWGPPPVIYPGGSGQFVLDVTATNRITDS